MGHAAGKTVIGLDIEPGYVAAVESRPGRIAIERAAVAPLAAGSCARARSRTSTLSPRVLRKLFAENKLSRRVRIGVASQRIVMRTLHLPPMTDQKELASAVRFQAQENIPMPLEQAVLEHHSLGIVETAEGPRTRVVVVAARRDMIDKLLEATRRAGLRPAGIDLSAFAMIRALHRAGDADASAVHQRRRDHEPGGCGRHHMRVHARRGTRHRVDGGDLAARRGLTLEHAHGWLRHVGLLIPIDDIDGDPEIVLEARHVLTGRGRADRRRGSQLARLLHDAGSGQPGAACRAHRSRGRDSRLLGPARDRADDPA